MPTAFRRPIAHYRVAYEGDESGWRVAPVRRLRGCCYKLGVRFQSDDMVKRFLASGRTGFYVAVSREGEVGAGDEITVLSRDPNGVTVSEITRLYAAKAYKPDAVASVRRAIKRKS